MSALSFAYNDAAIFRFDYDDDRIIRDETLK